MGQIDELKIRGLGGYYNIINESIIGKKKKKINFKIINGNI